ncbi:MAG TPA: hypothetical protein VGT79_03870, partial [Xanthomonadaceae bacterium]|nr:hypothetical protein [Xanthomonadaceae bacterium]
IYPIASMQAAADWPFPAIHRAPLAALFAAQARHRTPPLAAGTGTTLAEIPARNRALSPTYRNLATTLKN